MPLSDWTGYRINGLARRMREESDRALEPLGLSVKHFGALLALAEHGALAQHQLGQELRVDRTSMVALVEDLERAGHVARARNPADRRAYVIELTAAGKAARREAEKRLRQVERELLSALSAAERRQLVELLARLG
ncbi:MAG TPA: MarR family transcriptional regulator [Solirubrobacteraceae bacterium]|nr:MarR family transcriptional regulator [Solirubrobacteraceae bacterium]